jgi:hypothetical protein
MGEDTHVNWLVGYLGENRSEDDHVAAGEAGWE